MYNWDTKIRYVRTIGPTRSRELAKIGITTVGELLEYHPLSYIYPGATNIADAKEGMVVVVRARIRGINRGWGSTVKATLIDNTDTCQAIWYTSYAAQSLHTGMIATFCGKLKSGVLQQPKWCTHDGGMENVYGGQYGVHHDTIRAALKEVLANVELPPMNCQTNRAFIYKMFHFPMTKDADKEALNYLKHDEALTLQLALAERKNQRRNYDTDQSRIISCYGGLDTTIKSYFPYEFTDDQEYSLSAIRGGLSNGAVMQRLIHGEVGSGKTAVAFYAAMLVALNSKRTIIMAPTTILAQQHYDTLRGTGWDDVDLFGTAHYTDIGPFSNIIIGTHALLNRPHLLRSASLVIIDEFQKFGVEQRAKIQRHHPHLLLLSATPIPRTLAATVFGDLDVSVIRQLPIKRGTVVTRWILPEKREAMYEIIEKELAKGHQAYVVYPRISGDEDTINAIDGFVNLCERFNIDKGLQNQVDLLTGKDTAEMKMWSLKQFREGHTKILVSTIIAEVGLDNPNATVMVIEGADRFGLSQLHQLRGRVCRSIDTAFCFLISETSNPTSIARLEVIEKCNDGFEIAEHDLRLRGAGEVFSTRQTGLPALRWNSLVDDYDLMIEARETVQAGSVGSGVREMMRLRYGKSLELGGVV